MAIDAKTLAASKKYTNETVVGGGAIKGKNCTIQSIIPLTTGFTEVTFKWTLDDGTIQYSTMLVPDGAKGDDGLGVKSVDINEDNHLIVTFDDDTTHDAGEIPSGGGTGEVISVNGKKGVVKLNATDIPVSDTAGADTIALSIDHLMASDLALKVAIENLDLLVASKVDKEAGKGLSTNDFTTLEKTKLENLEPIYLIGSGLNLDPTTGKLSATGMDIPIDTALNPTSVNPVQNQAIAVPMAALQGSVAGVKLEISQLSASMLAKADKAEIPTKLSELTNDEDFVSDSSYVHTDENFTSAEKTSLAQIPLSISQLQASLLTKAPQSSTYSKSEVDQMISAISSLKIEVVSALPTTDISQTTIYLVPKSGLFTDNVYDEYINLDGTTAGWEKIGDTKIDLTNYIQKSDTAGLVKNDGNIETQIPLTVSQLQASVLNVKLDISQLQGSLLTKAEKTELNQIRLDIGQLQGSMLTKADKSELDEWSAEAYVNASKKVIFDDLDDSLAYNLYGWDRLVRIDSMRKDPGTNTGIKLTFSVDAPQNTKCILRIMK